MEEEEEEELRQQLLLRWVELIRYHLADLMLSVIIHLHSTRLSCI